MFRNILMYLDKVWTWEERVRIIYSLNWDSPPCTVLRLCPGHSAKNMPVNARSPPQNNNSKLMTK